MYFLRNDWFTSILCCLLFMPREYLWISTIKQRNIHKCGKCYQCSLSLGVFSINVYIPGVWLYLPCISTVYIPSHLCTSTLPSFVIWEEKKEFLYLLKICHSHCVLLIQANRLFSIELDEASGVHTSRALQLWTNNAFSVKHHVNLNSQ